MREEFNVSCLCFAGSRAGAVIAACWATMMLIGRDGYVDATRRIIETTRHIEAESVLHYLQSFLRSIISNCAYTSVLWRCWLGSLGDR